MRFPVAGLLFAFIFTLGCASKAPDRPSQLAVQAIDDYENLWKRCSMGQPLKIWQ
jgi:hypothetical protein